MLKSMAACCKLYISESRNPLALESIERAARSHPEAIITNRFSDEAYNRVGYTLVSLSPSLNSALVEAAASMVEEAFRSIDLGSHCGTHPRLGVVDHICFHPLVGSALDQSAGLAKMVAAAIAQSLQGAFTIYHISYCYTLLIRHLKASSVLHLLLPVPVFLYGAAHESGRTLAGIRRELGYFKPSSGGSPWANGLSLDLSRLKPDQGPSKVDPARGVVVVGATRWVDNYNVPVRSTDISVVRGIARRVSGRGGGFESVQAMALAHGEDCIEVACNLLEPDRVGADRVQLEVQRLAAEEGLVVERGYFTDMSRAGIIESYVQKLAD